MLKINNLVLNNNGKENLSWQSVKFVEKQHHLE